MAVATLIDRLRGTQARETKLAVIAYKDLVKQTADGKHVCEGTALAAMRAAGRSTDDLLADVKRIERRRELAQRVADRPAIEKKQAELGREAASVQAAYAEAYTKYQKTVTMLAHRKQQLDGERRASRDAERELAEGSERAPEHDELVAIRAKLYSQKIAIKSRLETANSQVSGWAKREYSGANKLSDIECKRRAAGPAALAKSLTADSERLTKELAACDKRISELAPSLLLV